MNDKGNQNGMNIPYNLERTSKTFKSYSQNKRRTEIIKEKGA